MANEFANLRATARLKSENDVWRALDRRFFFIKFGRQDTFDLPWRASCKLRIPARIRTWHFLHVMRHVKPAKCGLFFDYVGKSCLCHTATRSVPPGALLGIFRRFGKREEILMATKRFTAERYCYPIWPEKRYRFIRDGLRPVRSVCLKSA